jgi:hypothetical protein
MPGTIPETGEREGESKRYDTWHLTELAAPASMHVACKWHTNTVDVNV